jgi:hypothetical protein
LLATASKDTVEYGFFTEVKKGSKAKTARRTIQTMRAVPTRRTGMMHKGFVTQITEEASPAPTGGKRDLAPRRCLGRRHCR